MSDYRLPADFEPALTRGEVMAARTRPAMKPQPVVEADPQPVVEATRVCAACGAGIDDRDPRAFLCVGCAALRRNRHTGWLVPQPETRECAACGADISERRRGARYCTDRICRRRRNTAAKRAERGGRAT